MCIKYIYFVIIWYDVSWNTYDKMIWWFLKQKTTTWLTHKSCNFYIHQCCFLYGGSPMARSAEVDPWNNIVVMNNFMCVSESTFCAKDCGDIQQSGIAQKLGKLCPRNASRNWWSWLGGGPEPWPNILWLIGIWDCGVIKLCTISIPLQPAFIHFNIDLTWGYPVLLGKNFARFQHARMDARCVLHTNKTHRMSL